MKKFYLISNDLGNETATAFKAGCAARKIEFVGIDVKNVNPSELAQIDVGGQMMYRAATTKRGRAIELLLLSQAGCEAATIYRDPNASFKNELREIMIFAENGIAQPKTLPFLPSDKDALSQAVDFLGGFPVIVKILGGQKGVGVVKIDSIGSLLSVADVLLKRFADNYIVLREYVRHDEQARLTVLGDKVISGKRNIRHGDEFRLNVGEDRVEEVKEYSDEVNDLAVKAVNLSGFDFGAVDILIDRDTGEAKVSEVNTPCNFIPAQKTTGVDIAGAILDFLSAKLDGQTTIV